MYMPGVECKSHQNGHQARLQGAGHTIPLVFLKIAGMAGLARSCCIA